MSRFRDDFAFVIQDMFFERGEEIVYRPIGGKRLTPTAICVLKTGTIKDGQQHHMQQTVMEVMVMKSDVPNPREGDIIERDNQLWDFSELAGDDGDVMRMHFTKCDVHQYGSKPSQL